MTERPLPPVAPTTLLVPLLADFVTLAKAATLLPDRPHVKTVEKWGLHGRNGVRLRVARSGRRVLTTSRWMAEFLVASAGGDLTDAHSTPAVPQSTSTPARTEQRAARSTTKSARVEALRAAGVRR